MKHLRYIKHNIKGVSSNFLDQKPSIGAFTTGH